MIPTLEEIVAGMADGSIPPAQALAWIHEHMDTAEFLDGAVLAAFEGLLAGDAYYRNNPHHAATKAYEAADLLADLRERRRAPVKRGGTDGDE